LPIEALYREHFLFIWRSLRRLGVRESSVDDAVQDVFLVAHRKLAEFEGRSSHRVWLFAIAIRVAAEYRRRDGRLQLDEDGTGVAIQSSHVRGASAPFDPEKTLGLRRQVQQLDELLGTLSDPQREVFVMAEVEGFSVPEIAEALGEKLNTVYSRLRLGRSRFERALARQQHGERDKEST
jgi:RNA polymerase sigma-70 factor (ECF subfamily)